MPVLTLGTGYIPTFGGKANTVAEYGMKIFTMMKRKEILLLLRPENYT